MNRKSIGVNDFKGKVKGVLFLSWFVLSLIALFVLTKVNVLYAIVVFGNYFFVFGCIIFCQKESRIGSIPFLLVGMCCIGIPLFMLNDEIFSFEIVWKDVIVFLFGFISLILGIIIIYHPHKMLNYLKKVCVYSLSAVLIRYEEVRVKHRKLYSPVYKFTYNGKEYEVNHEIYSSFNGKEIDSLVGLKINPQNPYEFMEEDLKISKLVYVIGGACMFAFIIIMFYLK